MPRPDPARVAEALGAFPAPAREALRAHLAEGRFRGVIPAAQAREMTAGAGMSIPELMLALVPFARLYAAPPVSEFHVGAVALGGSGSLYFGANMEFVGEALPASTHAEQSAVANAWANGETSVGSVAVSAPPCGYCRQFLNELASADRLVVHLPDKQPLPLATLLPESFGPRNLDVDAALLEPQDHPLRLLHPSDDPVVDAALAAARASYAPYSRGYAGVALALADGEVIGGRLAENAAFNPSLSPLEAALSALNLAGRGYDEIRRAVLVEATGVLTSQHAATRSVLACVAPRLALERHEAVAEPAG